MVNAGIAKNMATIFVTAQSTSHLKLATRARETPAGCLPRVMGTPKCERCCPQSNALSQQSSKQEMTCPGTPMERSRVNEKLRGLYLPGFPAGSRVRQTAFEAQHSLTTASHRGVRKTLSALQSRYYWPGLVARCHVCGSKKTWGRKRRAPLKQYVVGAPIERIAIDILGPLPETPRRSKFILVVSDYPTRRTPLLRRSL